MHLNKLIYKNITWRGFFYVTAFVLNIAIVRVLGAEFSGKLYFFLNNLSLALLIGSISLESGITYYISKRALPEQVLASFAVVWSIGVTLIISLFFLVFDQNGHQPVTDRFFFLACGCFILGNILNSYFNAFFYTIDNYRAPNLITGCLNLVLLLFVPWKPNWLGFIDVNTFLKIFFAISLLQGIIVCLAWFISRKNYVFTLAGLTSILPAMKYSLAALVGNIAYFILYRIDYWYVEYYCTAKDLGNYIQVARVGQLLVLPSIIIAGTLFPQSSKQRFSFATTEFKNLVRVIAVAYLGVGILLLILGKWAIFLLWGSEFDAMYQPLLLTMPGIVFLAISYLFSPTFAGIGKVSYNVLIAFVCLVVVVVCNFWMVPAWGINGAAIATSIGFAVMMLLYFIIASVKNQFSVRSLFVKS